MAAVLIDRADVHKSCKSLEGLVAVLNDYIEVANSLATVRKKLAKALKESATVKGTNTVPANAMANSANVFEALAEIDVRFTKIVDKEAESVGSELKKWFKKLAKEEKAHDERIATANAKIKQAGQVYEKKAKRKDRDAPDEHSRYLAILNSVGPEMSQDKYNHNYMVTQRHTVTLAGCAASLARLAESEWARTCECVRRSAPFIGNVGEWRAFCEAGWTGPTSSLPDLDVRDLEREKKSLDTTTNNTSDGTRTLMPPPSTSSNENQESPASPSVGHSSETNSLPEHSQPLPSRPPPNVQESAPNTLRNKPERSNSANVVSIAQQLTTSNDTKGSVEAPASTNTLSADSSPRSPGDTRSAPPTKEPEAPPLAHEKRQSPDEHNIANAVEKLMFESKPPVIPLPDPLANPESLPRDPPVRTNDSANDHERDQKVVSPSVVSPKFERKILPTALERRLSVESTMSNGSLVAAMRDRYDTRPAQPSSPPRDIPRPAQSVANIATRYTPVGSPGTSHRGLTTDRFPTFQDRYPRSAFDRDRDRDRDKDRDRYRGPPEAPIPGRDYYAENDAERYPVGTMDRNQFSRDTDRYPPLSPVATMDRNKFLRAEGDTDQYLTPSATDRNKFLREDRERYRPRSPEMFHADEMGVRERPRRIDPVSEERALDEREARLRERERQLEMERARLAVSRDGGYVSDTSGRSPYGTRRRMESPEPLGQSLRPPDSIADHAPNCGCERCSARHYASSTQSLSSYERPEPPIKLRPEKPKGWLRRLSMPSVASSTSKSGALGVANMSVPEEDGRVGRRSFEVEGGKAAAGRYGTARR